MHSLQRHPGRRIAGRAGFGSRVLIALVRGWQLVFSTWLPPTCRYLPSCSDYAVQALSRHGPWRGGWLAACRLARCHPFGASGVDEVPDTDYYVTRTNPRNCGCSNRRHLTDS